MKRVENTREGPAEKQENLGEKLKKGALLVVGKRGGHNTPVIPSWRLVQLPPANSDIAAHDSIIKLAPFPLVSARKLAATLWELHHYNLPIAKMHQGVTAPPPGLRRHRRHRDPSPSSPEQLESASSLRRHGAASLMQHHRSIQRNNHAIQPVSPASYGSSMEVVVPYNPAGTPTSSVDFKGGIGEVSYSLKTSTELLKVLNRIWGLEEQHASNISLVKALKKELDHARIKIKDLVRDQQADRHEMDELMKQIAEDNVVRKSKEQDRIKAAIQSVRDELEDERRLRRRSESLHRNLAWELCEVKTSLANTLIDLEKERKSQKLLEDLCDEFAWEIRDYEQELHVLKQKSEKDWAYKADRDRLILHISDSWLDIRNQMKVESQSGLGEKKSIVDKLTTEIATYLQTKQSGNYQSQVNLAPKDPTFRRSSLESIPLNVAMSAPQDEGDEDDSAGSDSHCFELDKPVANLKPEADETKESLIDTNFNPNQSKNKPASLESTKRRHPTSLRVKFEEQMAQAISRDGIKNQAEDTEQGKTAYGSPVEVNISKKNEIYEAAEEDSQKKTKADGFHELSSNYIDNLIRSGYLLSESGNLQPENDYRLTSGGNSTWKSHASPVRQWTAKLQSQDIDIPESSSKVPSDLKANTLKEKLLEARTRGQRSGSRLKGPENFLEGLNKR